MKIYQCAQRSAEWKQLRCGKVTASEFSRLITPKTAKLSAQAVGYFHVLLAEWALGAPLPSIETDWMQRGVELEDQAVKAYEFETGLETETVGFVTTDDGLVGCSPDRLVGNDGGLELKCPAANTHIGHMLKREIDEKHAPQVQGCIYLCERDWWDVESFYPGLPTVVIRSNRDEKYIALLKSALDAFVETMMAARAAIVARYGQFPIVRPAAKAEDFGELGISEADGDAIWEAYQETNKV